jgi:eukaryotic-like serine/threonine-protein kinase
VDTKPTQCDKSRIARFLNAELTADEEQLLEQHLDTCSKCSARLDESTAEAAVWHETGDLLRDEPTDLEPLSAVLSNVDDDAIAQHVVDDSIRRVLQLLNPTDDPQMLGRIGCYEVAGVIGSGGNGVVLKGHDQALNRYVAIKILAPHLASSGAARGRFAREAQAAAAVMHENVIAIHGVEEHGGLPFLVMPYVRGTSLQKRIDQKGTLALLEILRIGMQAAAGLAAAHAQGLVHRDIKPANILLEEGVERVTITDFGLARAVDDASMTRSGIIAGTPQFMSPEQAQGEPIDHRSDLFSLGSVLYAMGTGHPPFRAETSYGVLQRICQSTPRAIRQSNPDVPPWLCRLIERLHEKEPEDRFQSAAEVADLMSQCVAHVQQPDTQPLPSELHEKHAGVRARRRWAWPVALVGALAVAATSAALWLNRGDTVDGNPVSGPLRTPEAEGEADLRWDDEVDTLLLEVDDGIEQFDKETRRLFDAP